MLLQFASGIPFATGASSYLYKPVLPTETVNRILLNVQIGSLKTQAYLDTGAVYMICAPAIGDALQLSETDSLGSERLLFRGTSYNGIWPREFRCILGMAGCFERLRFAIDPFEDTIYFGAPTADF